MIFGKQCPIARRASTYTKKTYEWNIEIKWEKMIIPPLSDGECRRKTMLIVVNWKRDSCHVVDRLANRVNNPFYCRNIRAIYKGSSSIQSKLYLYSHVSTLASALDFVSILVLQYINRVWALGSLYLNPCVLHCSWWRLLLYRFSIFGTIIDMVE